MRFPALLSGPNKKTISSRHEPIVHSPALGINEKARDITSVDSKRMECMTRKENARSSASGVPALDTGRRGSLGVLLALGICGWSIAYGQTTDRAPQRAYQIGASAE